MTEMKNNENNAAMNNELNDLRRERELLTKELLDDKENFALQMRDVLGEQIKRELTKQEKPQTQTEIKKPRRFKVFLDNITKMFVK